MSRSEVTRQGQPGVAPARDATPGKPGRRPGRRGERPMVPPAEPYSTGRGGGYIRASQALSVLGAAGALLGRRHRVLAALSGAALLGASAATRWGMFHAGLASAKDPKYTVIPQRQRKNGTQATTPDQA